MLTIRQVTKATELKRFNALEGEYHYMGQTHSGGDTMRLVIEDSGEWLALMVWGSACYHLKPRDEYIGWPNSLRAQRQKLVINNRRFTILAKRGTRPNLASQCLGLAHRELPGMWLKKFGYKPLIAETFCDIEYSAGVCYKASNWIQLGVTKGFSRVNRQCCDFYVPNGRPKTVWVRPFVPDAVETLNAKNLPKECVRGAQSDAQGVLPVSRDQVESLFDALRHVKDWRDKNRTFPIGGMLAIVVMGSMNGLMNVKSIARFAQTLTMPQRKALCMPHAKNKNGVTAKHEYKVPSYVTLYNFLRGLDLDDFGRKLTGWMSGQEGRLPRHLAIDGKFVKDTMGIVSVVNAETGAPVAVASCSRKEGETGKCEMPVARQLLGEMNLENALVSSDALHCQQDTAREIVCAGGEHIMQIKGNQKGLLRNAKAVIAARHPVASKKNRKLDTDGAKRA